MILRTRASRKILVLPVSEWIDRSPDDVPIGDVIDVAIESGVDFDGSVIPAAKLDLYHSVMALEAGRQRSGVSNTM